MAHHCKLLLVVVASLTLLQTFDPSWAHLEVSTQHSHQDEEVIKPRNINDTIPETNVYYWKELPQTGGIRYQNCSVPVEDTRVFMDCVTEGGSEMSRAVCKCVITNNTLYITCYKDDNWYPPITGACVNEGEMIFNETNTATPESATTSNTETKSAGNLIRLNLQFIITTFVIYTVKFM